MPTLGAAAKDRVAGSSATGDLIFRDFDALVSAFDRLPSKVKELGTEGAVRYVRVEMRVLVDAVALSGPRTPMRAALRHRAHVSLSSIARLVLDLHGKRAGAAARTDYLEGVERAFLAPSIPTVYAHSRDEAEEREYVPDTG